MQRFSVFLLICLMCLNARAGANLPVVDVSNGTVSARAIFGEEITQKKQESAVAVAPVKKKTTERKVVARNAKKSANVKPRVVATNDVLKPNKPRSDLWANNDAPLRMPRMDEISVMRSDALLPEETLTSKSEPIKLADNTIGAFELNGELLAENNMLRDEIARLNAIQKQEEKKVAVARPVAVQTPVTGYSNVQPAKSTQRANMRREIVPMDEHKTEFVPMTERKTEIIARRAKPNVAEPKIVSGDTSMTKLSPSELKKAFKKTYLSENKHLSTYVDDKYDVVSEMSSDIEGFSAQRDLSELSDGIRPLEVKISFFENDAGLSRANYDLLTNTASIVVNNPKRAIQVAIPESATYSRDARKLAARRLAIVEQVLRDTGVADKRIVPVLSQRSDDVFVLRVISGEVFETLTQQKRNSSGRNVSKKTYKNMAW